MGKLIRLTGIVVVALAALGSTACSKKADECNAIIDVYNRGLDANRAVKGDDPEAASKLGAVWGKEASEYAKLTLTTPELKTIAGKLQSEAQGASTGLANAEEGGAAGVKPHVEAYAAASKELQTFCGVEEKK